MLLASRVNVQRAHINAPRAIKFKHNVHIIMWKNEKAYKCFVHMVKNPMPMSLEHICFIALTMPLVCMVLHNFMNSSQENTF